MTSLVVPKRQVQIYFGKCRAAWHHRRLLDWVSRAGWVVATPTLGAEVCDLDAAEDLRPLGLSLVLPEARQPLFAFDELSAVEIHGLRSQARRFACVIGDSIKCDFVGGKAMWLYADPSHEEFGKVVDSNVVGGGRAMLRGRAESGRDSRPNAVGNDRDGDRDPVGLAETARKKMDMPSRFFGKPTTIGGLFESITATGLEPQGYLTHYLQSSGLAPLCGGGNRARILITEQRCMIKVDRLNVGNVAVAETLTRRSFKGQRVERRNYHALDSNGLENFTWSVLAPRGNLQTAEFVKIRMEVWKTEDVGQMSPRVPNEELGALKKSGQRSGGGGKGSEAAS